MLGIVLIVIAISGGIMLFSKKLAMNIAGSLLMLFTSFIWLLIHISDSHIGYSIYWTILTIFYLITSVHYINKYTQDV